jgi:hypothetical protein
LAALKRELAGRESELAAYGDCDPAKIEEMKRAVFLAKEASLRWTGKLHPAIALRELTVAGTTCTEDNYGMLLAHFTRQNGVEPAEIRRYLGIDEVYEDIC